MKIGEDVSIFAIYLTLRCVAGEGRRGNSRGGNQIWMLKPQVNFNVIPIYKSREKRIFEFGDRLHPPHWPSRFSKSLCKGQKSKLSQTYGMTYPDVGEKGNKPLGKELAQSGNTSWEKNPKNTRKYLFPRKKNFRVVFWIFLLTGKPDWANSFPSGLVPFSPTSG